MRVPTPPASARIDHLGRHPDVLGHPEEGEDAPQDRVVVVPQVLRFDLKLTWFVGVDWGSQKHQACVLDAAGKVLGERAFEHGGVGLSEMADWLLSFAASETGEVGGAIETPRGPVVESLMERGFAVHSINPKQLDRFRDRISPAGAKDDRRDARVLASALRTRLALSSTAGADGPGNRRVAGVVAPERGPDAGTRSPGEPDARAALALLPAVPRRG